MSYVDVVEKTEVPRPPKFYTEPRFEKVLGLPVAYRRKGNGEPAVLFHGAGFTRMWIPLYENLSKQLDFIAPECPGFGETPLASWIKGFDDLVILYDQFFEQLGLDQVHLIGFSMGGWAAAEFASYYPRRVKSLSLITPVGLRLEHDPGVDLFQLAPQDLMDRLFKDKTVMAEWLPDMDDFDEGVHAYTEFSAAARFMWAPRYNLALEHRLQRVSCQSLVVGAEEDRLIPNEMSDRFVEFLPRSELVRIPGTGHEVCLERPNELADTLINFILEASK